MQIMVKNDATFAPAPAGTHAAVCVDVIDHGMVDVSYQGKIERKQQISVVWQIDENRDDGKPFLLRRRYNATLRHKSSLKRDLENWRGRPFTAKELEEGFNMENLLSAGCLINVVHETRNGETYANVNSIMRLTKGTAAPTPRDYVRVSDRPPAQREAANAKPEITDDDVPF